MCCCQKDVEDYQNDEDAFLRLSVMEIVKSREQELQECQDFVPILKTYRELLTNSLKDASNDFSGHYREDKLTLPKRKSISVDVKLTKRKLNDDLTLEDEGEAKEYKLLVERFDFITPKVGMGMFFGSTTLRGFGVANNENGEQVVTEDNIDANNPVAGAFLNLHFDIGTQFLAPLIQIGVDPTKERPFLLAGGGFKILDIFSLTGGPIWTWEAELGSLSVGDVVESTSALEQDIGYKFQSSPSGFYIGLNYSF